MYEIDEKRETDTTTAYHKEIVLLLLLKSYAAITVAKW